MRATASHKIISARCTPLDRACSRPWRAAEWYRRAAESEIPHAQRSLGVAYALGRGISRDLLQARKWLYLAIASCTTDEDRDRAVKARDVVATKMTADEIAQAQRLAREWRRLRDAARHDR
jgi:hypothetical protein